MSFHRHVEVQTMIILFSSSVDSFGDHPTLFLHYGDKNLFSLKGMKNTFLLLTRTLIINMACPP